MLNIDPPATAGGTDMIRAQKKSGASFEPRAAKRRFSSCAVQSSLNWTRVSAVNLISELRPMKAGKGSKPQDQMMKAETSCRECP